MALAGLAHLDLAARGEAKALFGAGFGLQFGHFASPVAARSRVRMKEPPRHALSPGGSKRRRYTRHAGICKRAAIGPSDRMKLPRPLLHAARIANEVLFYPALVVVRGELAPVEPDAFGWLAGINDKLLHFAAYFGLSVMAGAAVRRRKTAILGASAWCCWAARWKSSRAMWGAILRFMTNRPTSRACLPALFVPDSL